MVHVRRATIGGLTLENTHPFTRGPYSYCHNGTILKASELEPLADRPPVGDTDSERFFNLLMTDFDSGDVIASLRRAVERTCDACRFSALNFLVLRRRRLYAYRFGVYRLFSAAAVTEPRRRHPDALHLHLERPRGEHVVLVASEKLTEEEHWSEFGQDELLVCDPGDPDHPRIQRLLGAARELGRVRAARRGRADRRRARRVGCAAGGHRLLTGSRRSGRQRLARGLPGRLAAAPWTWRLLRRPVTRFFDQRRRGMGSALRERPRATRAADRRARPAAPRPSRVLDVGTGTGAGAMLAAGRWPDCAGDRDRRRPGDDRPRRREKANDPRIRFLVADVATLDPGDGYDLVMLLNMPPFFEHVARLRRPGGHVVVIASRGPTTPFFTPAATLAPGSRARPRDRRRGGGRPRHVLPCAASVSADRRFAILMNPASAGGKPLRVLPEPRELDAAGAEHRVVETRDMAHATHAAREARGRGEVVVALGGDGLVGKLAGALRGSTPLGVVPAGRGNDFARALGIPEDVGGATRVLLDGVRKALDLGEANGRPVRVHRVDRLRLRREPDRERREARERQPRLRVRRDPRAVAWKPTRFTVRLDGREHRFEGYTVAAANTGYYGGGMNMAPGADPSDGLLDVIMVEQVSKLRFLANLPKVFKGTHVDQDAVKVERAREVEIAADRPFDVYADGDPLTTLPATVRLVRGGLSVIAPRA